LPPRTRRSTDHFRGTQSLGASGVSQVGTRRLDHIAFPYICLDAIYLHVLNATSQVVSMAMVVASGIRADAVEILGLDAGDSEDEVFWRALLTDLKKRLASGARHFKAQLLHEVLRLDVRELLGDTTVAHTEDVGSPDVTALGILLVEGVGPEDNDMISKRNRLFGLEPARQHQLEGTGQDGANRLLAFEASPARVLKRHVIGHQPHHSLDVVPVERFVESRNDIHFFLLVEHCEGACAEHPAPAELV
jgi:Transposase, Mutator family